MSNHNVLGIIGGGQLGSMLCQAAKNLGVKTVIYCNDKDSPAKHYSNKFICGEYNDDTKIEKFTKQVDVVTFEFENIPVPTLKKIQQIKPVYPDPNVNFIIQHRIKEKNFINQLGIKTVDYKNIYSYKDVEKVENLLPGILKTTTLGYDGKGQYIISNSKDFEKINFKDEFILEKKINLKKEISVIITRYQDGNSVVYDPIENVHKDQILDTSKIPSSIDHKIAERSKESAIKLANKLDYTGTMCVEYFIDENNELLVNEIAPRVHNSGHLTINAYNVSQFESHVRSVCNLEVIEPVMKSAAIMQNIIGDDIFNFKNKEFKSNEYFFDYLKKEAKPKRKMGHLTILKV
tara:strand:- start:2541 stop:3584 length:1044 start_codon:yes stop_codon:yes gene_type:complete